MSQKENYVTVAIPFYNAEKHLKGSIESILSQTHTKFELLLVDDGSTDDSLKIAQSFKDDRIRIISDGLNKGLASRLNQIIDLARYDFIARMDADDLCLPDRLAVQLDNFTENVDIVSCGMCSVNSDERIVGIRNRDNSNISSDDLFYTTHGIVHAAIIVRKSWYLRNRYDVRLKRCQDYELWVRAFSKNDLKVRIIPNIFYIYREEHGITAGKMLFSCRTSLMLLRTYPNIFNNKLKKYSRIIFKFASVYLLNKVGRMDLILKRRNSSKLDILSNDYKNVSNFLNSWKNKTHNS
ncbi:glycosyltransferase family 2 protein [Vibrio breoganii]